MQERRTTRRIPVHLPVDHIISDAEICGCTLQDVSLDGLRLSKAPGESWGSPRHVWLQFRLPEPAGEPIKALAELRHDDAHADAAKRGFLIKYIYPRDRRRYEAFVRAAMERASIGLA